jgi:hypothetical protein
MNVEIGNETAQFHFWEYIIGSCLQCVEARNSDEVHVSGLMSDGSASRYLLRLSSSRSHAVQGSGHIGQGRTAHGTENTRIASSKERRFGDTSVGDTWSLHSVCV